MTETYQRAFITGATAGIGRAFAEVLPPETDLLLTGRNEAALDELGKALDRPGRTVETRPADLRRQAARDEIAAWANDRGVDLFFNNAGLGYYGSFAENAPEAEAEMVAVNVVAVHGLTRALLPGMVARAEAQGRRAGLVVVASTAGHLPLPRFATYAATKAFDLAFAEGLAAEMKEAPIDILALCPGTTTTEFQQRSAMPARMFERAESAESVARKALRALGRRRVLVTPPLLRLGLLYNVIARRVGVAGAGAYFRRFGDG